MTQTSQKDFAEKYDFSKTTMIFVESGQFNEISDDLNLALGKECAEKGVDAKAVLKAEYSAQSLSEAYQTWKSNERSEIAYKFQTPISGQFDKDHSPFYYFVIEKAGSSQGFCKLLKVPTAAVLRYSRGETRTMPKAIEDGLRAVNFPYLADLLALQANWVDARS